MTDTFDALASYAPTPESIRSEWGPASQDAVLAAILGGQVETPSPSAEILILPQLPPAPRRSRMHLVAASVVALTAAISAIIALTASGGTSQPEQAAGPATVFNPPAGLSDTALPQGEFSYRVVEQIQLNTAGKPITGASAAMVDRSYVNAAGDIVSFRTGSQNGCFRFPNQDPGFTAPSMDYLAKLPTDVTALRRYLRAHVTGSSSRDEAVFVSVGDALRTADGLASPKLRGALLGVLSRTPGVHVHTGQQDYLGRPAIRADFVDQQIRPGQVQSLYFDPATFQLLQEGDWSNGQPTTYAGPSPAYTAHAPTGADPEQLSAAGFIQVMTHEQVADSLPHIPTDCH